MANLDDSFDQTQLRPAGDGSYRLAPLNGRNGVSTVAGRSIRLSRFDGAARNQRVLFWRKNRSA